MRRLVDYLQRSDFAGVILTREEKEGTFTLAQLAHRTLGRAGRGRRLALERSP